MQRQTLQYSPHSMIQKALAAMRRFKCQSNTHAYKTKHHQLAPPSPSVALKKTKTNTAITRCSYSVVSLPFSEEIILSSAIFQRSSVTSKSVHSFPIQEPDHISNLVYHQDRDDQQQQQNNIIKRAGRHTIYVTLSNKGGAKSHR